MCGRYSLAWDTHEIERHFGVVASMPPLQGRYNIAPSQPALIVHDDRDRDRRRTARYVQWGLVPFWAKDPAIGNRMINARGETIATKPAYKAAAKYRRCLVPASGFFEWAKVSGGKQPHYFRYEEARPLAMAGLYEHWQDDNGTEIETCTIITTQANRLLADIHDRMPVLIQPNDYARWLDTTTEKPDAVADLIRPADAAMMVGYPVSRRVNSPANDDASLIETIETQQDLFGG
jgi:putative SOS response-associated peptidase YedK